MSRVPERLADIFARDKLEAIDNIERYAVRGRDAFEQGELVQVWVLHHLRVIGGAVRVVKPQLAGAHPNIPWSSIIGMRNTLVHHYFAVDTDLVWRVVEDELAPLKQAVVALLAQTEY